MDSRVVFFYHRLKTTLVQLQPPRLRLIIGFNDLSLTICFGSPTSCFIWVELPQLLILHLINQFNLIKILSYRYVCARKKNTFSLLKAQSCQQQQSVHTRTLCTWCIYIVSCTWGMNWVNWGNMLWPLSPLTHKNNAKNFKNLTTGYFEIKQWHVFKLQNHSWDFFSKTCLLVVLNTISFQGCKGVYYNMQIK